MSLDFFPLFSHLLSYFLEFLLCVRHCFRGWVLAWHWANRTPAFPGMYYLLGEVFPTQRDKCGVVLGTIGSGENKEQGCWGSSRDPRPSPGCRKNRRDQVKVLGGGRRELQPLISGTQFICPSREAMWVEEVGL